MRHGYLIDMDGVIYRGSAAIPGAAEFIRFLQMEHIPYLFLTNNSAYTPLDVVFKLKKHSMMASGRANCLDGTATFAKSHSNSRLPERN